MKKNKKQKGFTLVEILVVVVILAILAALILPRFLSQPENAFIAEANQTLGALRRGYAAGTDLGNAPGNLGAGDVTLASKMSPYGMQPLAAETNWKYTCTSGACVATSTRDSTKKVNLAADGTFSCTGYNLISAQKGCKV